MYIILRKDIIDYINKTLGTSLTNLDEYRRICRIEYRAYLNTDIFIKIEHDESDFDEERLLDHFNSRKKYGGFTGNYDEFKIEEINESKYNVLRDIGITQHFWLDDEDIIVASGLKIYSQTYTSMLLGQLFYITDKFREPSFEDTKSIEWNLINGLKTIVILPKKMLKSKEDYFWIISGKTIFFDRTDVWKTNL